MKPGVPTIKAALEDVRFHEDIAVFGAEVSVALEHLGDVLLSGGHFGSTDHDCRKLVKLFVRLEGRLAAVAEDG